MMATPRLVFFGTPTFAVPTLRELRAAGWTVAAVITQPDRPRGRGQKRCASPVKLFAQAHGLQVLQPDSMKDDAFLAALSRLAPDLGIVAAYGRILPQTLLDVPRFGMLNVHASLLPRWRGAAPVHRAIMAGDAHTGVSIMRVVQALDAGPVLATAVRPIDPEETSDQLEADLAELGARTLLPAVRAVLAGDDEAVPQDEARSTYAPRLTREDGRIDWASPARTIHNQVRGLWPWPHAATTLGTSRVIVLRTAVPAAPPVAASSTAPGTITAIERDGLIVAAGDGSAIRLLHLQAEGRRPVGGREFAVGARVAAGARFGP